MKRTYLVLTSLIMGILILNINSVWGSTQADINSKNAQIKQIEQQIKAIQSQKTQTAQQKSAKEQEINTLQSKVNSLNSDISNLQSQLNSVNQQISTTDNTIQQTTQTIQTLEQEITQKKLIIQNLVESLYKRSLTKNEIVAVVSSDTLSNVFNEIEYSNTIQQQIQETLTDVINKKTVLDTENQNLANQKASLVTTQDTLENQKNIVESAKNKTQNQANASAVAVNQLDASLSKLTSQEQSLEQRRRQTAVELANLEASLLRQYGGGGSVCSARGYAWPVQGGRISQGYGMTPFARTGAYGGAIHNGIDIAAPTGTAVFATSSGRVVSVGFNNNSYGKWIVIEHSDGYYSLYGHLSAQSVSNGQSVTRGQRIGSIGSTGFSSGPHLHFTIYLPRSLRLGSSPQGAPVNPSSCGY